MQFAKRVTSTRFRLGEILLDAGIISPEVLNQGLLIARRAAMPIGRVLVMSGHVTDLDINIAIETQSSIRTGSIDIKIAFELLRFAHNHQISIDEAYRRHGVGRDLGTLPRVGKLLLAAGLVDAIGMRCALKHSSNSGFPLGNSLVSLNLVAEPILLCCMNLQILIRDKYISFLDAVRCLKIVVAEQVTLETALKTIGVPFYNATSVPRMGELLVAAGLVLHADRMILLEMSAESDKPLGELLNEYSLVSPAVLDAVLKIQSMLNGGNPVFTKSRAIRLLQLVQSMDTPLETILAEFDVLDQVVTLLRVAGVVPDSLIEHTKATIKDHEQSVSEALITRGIINRDLSHAGMECLHKIQMGETSYEKALAYLVEYNTWLMHGNRPTEQPSEKTLAKLIELRRSPLKTAELPKPEAQNNLEQTVEFPKPEPQSNLEQTVEFPKPEPQNNLELTVELPKPQPQNNLELTVELPKPQPQNNLELTAELPKPEPPVLVQAKRETQHTSIGIIKPPTRPQPPAPTQAVPSASERPVRSTSHQAIRHDDEVNVFMAPPPIALDQRDSDEKDFGPPPISWESHPRIQSKSWDLPEEVTEQMQAAVTTANAQRTESGVKYTSPPPPPPPRPRSTNGDYERAPQRSTSPAGANGKTNACGIRVPAAPPMPSIPSSITVSSPYVGSLMRRESESTKSEPHDNETDPNLDVA